jgi:hypothetical protein
MLSVKKTGVPGHQVKILLENTGMVDRGVGSPLPAEAPKVLVQGPAGARLESSFQN